MTFLFWWWLGLTVLFTAVLDADMRRARPWAWDGTDRVIGCIEIAAGWPLIAVYVIAGALYRKAAR